MECKYIKSTGALVATIELIDTLWNVNSSVAASEITTFLN